MMKQKARSEPYPFLGYELAADLDRFYFRFHAYGRRTFWNRLGCITGLFK